MAGNINLEFDLKLQDGQIIPKNSKPKKNTVQSFFLPYKDFKPSWRGRSVRNVPSLLGKDVRGIGFFLGDKVQGKFKLDILNISASTQKDLKNILNKSNISSTSKRLKKDFDPMTINLVQ